MESGCGATVWVDRNVSTGLGSSPNSKLYCNFLRGFAITKIPYRANDLIGTGPLPKHVPVLLP